jgi:hypothetical protein
MAKKKAAKNKAEPWRHKVVHGKAHPDNNPPLQIVAKASDEAVQREEQSADAVRQKEIKPDWAAMPGGQPADPGKPAADQKPKVKKAATTKATTTTSSPAADTNSAANKIGK